MVAIARSSQRAGRICPPWIQRELSLVYLVPSIISNELSGDKSCYFEGAAWDRFCAPSVERDGSNALKSKWKPCWQRHAVQYEADIISLELPFD